MENSRRFNIVAGLYGNALEWFDFLLYASFSPLFATLYFPSHSYFISMMSTFGVFAVGFLIRPVGGLVLGHYGDRAGRRKALILSAAIMTVATICIAMLPSYEYIGIAAPVLFTFLRLMQGFAVGGELPSSATFIIETMFKNRRGLGGSLVLGTAFIGIFVGALFAALVTNLMAIDQMMWNWRFAYLIGGVLGMIGIYLRIKSGESPQFLQTREIVKVPFKLIMSEYKLQLMLAILLTSVLAIGNYMLIAYLNVFLTKSVGFALPDVLLINFIALFVLAILIPVMGGISDYVGFKRLFLAGLFGLTVCIYPIFILLNQHHFLYALYGELLLALVIAPLNATISTLIADMFPVNIRVSGISIGYNVGQALFGGTLPLIALTLMEYTGNSMAPAQYVLCWGAIVMIALSVSRVSQVEESVSHS